MQTFRIVSHSLDTLMVFYMPEMDLNRKIPDNQTLLNVSQNKIYISFNALPDCYLNFKMSHFHVNWWTCGFFNILSCTKNQPQTRCQLITNCLYLNKKLRQQRTKRCNNQIFPLDKETAVQMWDNFSSQNLKDGKSEKFIEILSVAVFEIALLTTMIS